MDFKDGICHVFLDLDGVVADFSGAMCSTMGLDPLEPKLRYRLENNCMVSDEIDGKAFWKKVDAQGAQWWANIPLTPWANVLWAKMNAIAPVSFLTAPHVGDHASLAGKSMWIEKHFNTDLYLVGKNKHFCASPTAILVDDYVKNIQMFVGAGGFGYLWPNPDKLKNSGEWEQEVDKAVGFVKEAIRGLSKKDILSHR